MLTLESDLPMTVSLLPAGSRKGKRSATEGAPFLPKKGRDCSDYASILVDLTHIQV